MPDTTKDAPDLRRHEYGFAWQGVERLAYKQDGDAPFRDVSRQILFSRSDLAGELRYFEVGPGGHTTLERHGHVHGVMIVRGRGHCLVGSEVSEIGPLDLVTIPGWTWHQFRAAPGEPLGFLAWSMPPATARRCRRRTSWRPCAPRRRSQPSSTAEPQPKPHRRQLPYNRPRLAVPAK